MRRSLFAGAAAVALATLIGVLAFGRGDPSGGSGGELWLDEAGAFAAARAGGRHVVIQFTADWCIACRGIEQTLNDAEVVAVMSESFVRLKLDITELSDRDEALQAKYRARTLPAVIFVDARGRELGRYSSANVGAKDFVAELRRIAAAHPPSASGDRRQML